MEGFLHPAYPQRFLQRHIPAQARLGQPPPRSLVAQKHGAAMGPSFHDGMAKILMRRRHQQRMRPTPNLPKFMGRNGTHMDDVQSGLGQGQEVLQVHLVFCRPHELHPQVLAFQVDVLQGFEREVEVFDGVDSTEGQPIHGLPKTQGHAL